jgi:hypothetical protein
VIVWLPRSWIFIKRTIRYQRPTPPVPATYADVRLPEEYITTTNSSCNTTTARMQKTEC